MKSNYDKKQNIVFVVATLLTVVELVGLFKLIKSSNQKVEDKLQVITNNYEDIKKLVERDKAVVLYDQTTELESNSGNVGTDINVDIKLDNYYAIYVAIHIDEFIISDTLILNQQDNSYAIVGSDELEGASMLGSTSFRIYENETKTTADFTIDSACVIDFMEDTDGKTVTTMSDYLSDESTYFYQVIGIY